MARVPSRKPTRQPSAARWRASATSSVRWEAAAAKPPAARSASRRNTVHCPLAIVRGGAAEPTDPGGPKRYTSVVSIEACTSCWRRPSQRKRAPTLRKSQPSVWQRRTSAASSPGPGTVSASSVTTQAVVAAARPCCSAHGLPTQPLGTGAPVTTSAPAARATSAVASVLSSSTTTSRWGVGSRASDSSSGPIRRASSRAGTTTVTEPSAKGDGSSASGGRDRAARASRAAATAPATSRAPNHPARHTRPARVTRRATLTSRRP